MKWKYIKRKQFLLIWLIVFLLAPSVSIHRLFIMTAPPPGSPVAPPPLLIPFGGVYFGRQLVEQALGGDFGDASMIFIFLILPIIVYTFFLSVLIYYIFRKIRHIDSA